MKRVAQPASTTLRLVPTPPNPMKPKELGIESLSIYHVPFF